MHPREHSGRRTCQRSNNGQRGYPKEADRLHDAFGAGTTSGGHILHQQPGETRRTGRGGKTGAAARDGRAHDSAPAGLDAGHGALRKVSQPRRELFPFAHVK